MASFRKRDGKWQARVKRHGFEPLARTFINKTDAEKWARSIEVQIERGTYTDPRRADRPGTTSLHDLIARYLRDVTPTKRNARSERYTLQRWQTAGFAPLPISDLTPALLAQWRDEQLDQKAAPGTVRNALASLSAVIRHAALEWGFEDLQNPVMKIKRPAPSKGRTRRLLPGELEAIRQATESPWLVPIVDLAVETAMRQGELASLKWEHVDLDGRTAYLPSTKNGDARTVPLSFGAIAVLREFRGGVIRQISGSVFPIASHAISVAFRRAVARARAAYEGECAAQGDEPNPKHLVNLRFHDLRHEAASRLFERGLDSMEVASVTGHRTLQMLKRYTHLKAKELARKLA